MAYVTALGFTGRSLVRLTNGVQPSSTLTRVTTRAATAPVAMPAFERILVNVPVATVAPTVATPPFVPYASHTPVTSAAYAAPEVQQAGFGGDMTKLLLFAGGLILLTTIMRRKAGR